VTQQLKQANDTVSRLQDELSDFRQRNAQLWEQEMKDRDSKISLLFFFILMYMPIIYCLKPFSRTG